MFRWHVRRKENVEKVRHDEAEARAQEEELKSRAEIAVSWLYPGGW